MPDLCVFLNLHEQKTVFQAKVWHMSYTLFLTSVFKTPIVHNIHTHAETHAHTCSWLLIHAMKGQHKLPEREAGKPDCSRNGL